MNIVFPNAHVIRIRQTTSTNHMLLKLAEVSFLPEGTVVATDCQTRGRGQGDNYWESEPCANLTFSIVLYPHMVKASEQFILSKVISLAVYDFISGFVHGVSIKWPNDVYVENRKISGLLIENFVEGAYLTRTIAGIGVNINQKHFLSGALNPVSLWQLTGNTCPLETCLRTLRTHIARRYQMIMENFDQLHLDYLHHLYRFGKLYRYSAAGVFFDATITGVNHYGMLEMITADNRLRAFGFKEVIYHTEQ